MKVDYLAKRVLLCGSSFTFEPLPVQPTSRSEAVYIRLTGDGGQVGGGVAVGVAITPAGERVDTRGVA